MVELLVIADDLTGACDTGAQFAGQGIPALVTMEVGYTFDSSEDEYSVIVADTEGRRLSAAEAAARVEAVVRRAREAGVRFFYKKTDSTLRGNIGAELQAFLQASGNRMLAFAPAFPRLGRFTRGGCQYVGDRLLHETAFAADPLNPVTESYIPAIICRQSDIPARIIGRDAHEALIDGWPGERIIVFDAESDDDLRRVGERLKRERLLGALAGSAGFAACLPELLELRTFALPNLDCPARMLAVNGSLNEVSLRQAAIAEECGFAVVHLPPEALIAEDGARSDAASEIIAAVTSYDAQGRDVMLRTVTRREDASGYEQHGGGLGLRHRQLSLRIAENTAKLISEILAQTQFGLLTVFGGVTLAAIVRAMGWRGLLPQLEILPGVILSEAADGVKKMWLITKAGGFGPEDVLWQIKDQLRKK
ncbi:MAG: four-carbon acid sugar kinase family protein [Blastocatellia bacterium]